MTEPRLTDLRAKLAKLTDLGHTGAVLGWDQETYLPAGATEARAHQLATLAGLSHSLQTDMALGALLGELSADDSLDETDRALVRIAKHDRDLATRLPERLVTELAEAESLGLEAWRQARETSDFARFAPALERLVELNREKAARLADPGTAPYDALLDLHEPGLTMAELDPVFGRLEAGTVALLREVVERGIDPDDSFLYRTFPADDQLAIATEIVGALGFDLERGRIDLTTHPFCTTFSSTDVRLTTRIHENDLRSCLFGLIHEAGHGMYEQGIDPHFDRTPLGSGASMGIHESQSLLWENLVGRSRPFWEWAFPLLCRRFPEQLSDIDADKFQRGTNRIRPSLNRVESDELTYNLHILLRYRIERGLFDGSVAVADIPQLWNDGMRDGLGIDVPSDRDGCLQDIHWAMGAFGYFPSYTLGKLYGAMLFEAARRDLPTLDDQLARGEFAPLLGWLRDKVHRHGRAKTTGEMIREATGEDLSEVAFLRHLRARIDQLATA